MAVKTDIQLNAAALIIKDETAAGANTATRVGTFMQDLVDSKVNVADAGTQTVINQKVSLTSANILTLNSAPFIILPAPGAGFYLDVLRVYYKFNFVTVEYNTNVSIQMLAGNGGTVAVTANTSVLGNVDSKIIRPTQSIDAAFSSNVSDYENTPVFLFASSGNPVGGDCTLDVYVSYIIQTI